jgi:predicted dehydrogenase
MPLKVAIVGCGKIADGHVEEIRKMPATAQVVAVADRELLMAEQLATRDGIPAHYDDVDRLLAAERPDVVHITTPPQSHLALARSAFDAGAHVYVEKPLTSCYADSRRLVHLARAARRQLTVGYSYHLDPAFAQLRELHARGALGDAVHVDAFFGYDLGSPFGRALLSDGDHWIHRMPGKLFQNNLDHALCELTYFLPDARADELVEADPLGGIRIAAQAWRQRPQRFGDGRDDMLDELRVTFTGGAASAFVCFSAHAKPAAHLVRVHGTRDTAQAHRGMATVTLASRPRLPSALGRLTPAFEEGMQFLREGARNVARFAMSEFHYFAGMNRLLSRFYESIQSGGPPPIAYRDILRVAAWMDEIWRQVPQDGRPT